MQWTPFKTSPIKSSLNGFGLVKKLATAALIVTAFTSQSAQAETVSMQTWNAQILWDLSVSGSGDIYNNPGDIRFAITGKDGETISVVWSFNPVITGPRDNFINLYGYEEKQDGNGNVYAVDRGLQGQIALLGTENIAFDQFGQVSGNLLTSAWLWTISWENFLVDGNANNFTVSANYAVSNVPAPAAVWLFASSLPLIARASRKKKQVPSMVSLS